MKHVKFANNNSRKQKKNISNGFADKDVAVRKHIAGKFLERDGFEIHKYNVNSPLNTIDDSTFQQIMNRIFKTNVAINVELLIPQLCNNVKEKTINKYKKYYNENAKTVKL